jgi:IS5 family transposase
MPAELVRVDELLDDAVFFDPFRRFFSPLFGRPSIPMETFLRMMFLKYRYRLGFESLCREVTDSVSWSRFCRIPLGGSVPHHSTLKKIAKRCGRAAIEQLNQALLAKAAGAKVLKTDRLRADSTVVSGDVRYPTDSGLMARGVIRLVALVTTLHRLGLAVRTTMRNQAPMSCARRRTDQAKAEAEAINAQMVTIAEASLAEAKEVARNARRGLRRAGVDATGKARAALAELDVTVERLERVVAQTRRRLAGDMPESATRLVSLHDPDARPIKKGRIGKPVEFGYLAQVVDNTDGIVVDHSVHVGNPPDGPLLAPAITRIKSLIGRAPKAVTADRGYGAATVQSDLEELGVRTVAIVRKGRQSAARQKIERRSGFRKLIKWRTGSEGRISSLKRGYGWGRTFMDGIDGAQTWCGYGIFAHNSVKISALITAITEPIPAPLPTARPERSPHKRTRPRPHPPPTLPLSA